MPNYGQASYWDKRYVKQSGTTFDWLENYGTIRSILNEHLVQPRYETWLLEQEKLAQEQEEQRLKEEAEEEEERLKQEQINQEQEEAKSQSNAQSQKASNLSQNHEEREAEVRS